MFYHVGRSFEVAAVFHRRTVWLLLRIDGSGIRKSVECLMIILAFAMSFALIITAI